MPFKEITKNEALEFSAFRCCICKDLASEVHHIIPQSENGSDGLDNAAPLCSSCHDLFGGNLRKREKLRMLRNHWWTLIKAKSELAYATGKLVYFEGISLDPFHRNLMKDKVTRLYHVVYENQFFEEAASQIFELIQLAQVQKPFYDRILHLEIEGHRTSDGEFDHDMFELQFHFIGKFLSRYLKEMRMPIGDYRILRPQINIVPLGVEIYEGGIQSNYDKYKSN